MLNSGPVPLELGKGRSRYHFHLLLQAAPLCWESAAPKAVQKSRQFPYPTSSGSCQTCTCCSICNKGTEPKNIQGLFQRVTTLPPMELQQTKPLMSALPSKQASHPLLRHLAVQGLEENLPTPSLLLPAQFWGLILPQARTCPHINHPTTTSSINHKREENPKLLVAWSSSEPPSNSSNTLLKEHTC